MDHVADRRLAVQQLERALGARRRRHDPQVDHLRPSLAVAGAALERHCTAKMPGAGRRRASATLRTRGGSRRPTVPITARATSTSRMRRLASAALACALTLAALLAAAQTAHASHDAEVSIMDDQLLFGKTDAK